MPCTNTRDTIDIIKPLNGNKTKGPEGVSSKIAKTSASVIIAIIMLIMIYR